VRLRVLRCRPVDLVSIKLLKIVGEHIFVIQITPRSTQEVHTSQIRICFTHPTTKNIYSIVFRRVGYMFAYPAGVEMDLLSTNDYESNGVCGERHQPGGRKGCNSQAACGYSLCATCSGDVRPHPSPRTICTWVSQSVRKVLIRSLYLVNGDAHTLGAFGSSQGE